MKTTKYMFLIAITEIIMLFSGCTKNEPLSIRGITKSIETQSKISISDYNVTLEDAEWYVKLRIENKAEGLEAKEVIPLSATGEEANVFLVNMKYEKGWYIISGDKRISPIIAKNDTGNLKPDCFTEYAKRWIKGTNQIIKEKKLLQVQKRKRH